MEPAIRVRAAAVATRSLSVSSPSRRWVSRRVLVHVAGRGVHVLSPRAECRVEPLPQLLSCHLISRIICCEHCTLPASLEARVWCVPRASVGSVWLHACSPLVQSNLIPLRRLRNPVRRVVAAAPWLSVPGRAFAVCAIHSCFRALVFSARCSRMQFDLRLVFRGWPRSLTSGSCSGDGFAV